MGSVSSSSHTSSSHRLGSIQDTRDKRSHNLKLLEELKEGDLVEIDRGVFKHWAVYIGNEEVVHLIPSENNGLGQVLRENFWVVTGNSKAMKNNEKDGKFTPLHQKQIVQNALSMIGNEEYNIVQNNCEHFAVLCRYGRKWSDQVNNFFKAIVDFIVSVMVEEKEENKNQKQQHDS